MQLAVIIPTHNRNDLMERTLRSLVEVDLPECYTRTIVVENGGQFGVERLVAECPDALRAEYFYSAPGNKSQALNAVLEHVTEDLLVFFDDDVRIDRGTLVAFAEAAAEIPGRFYGGPVSCDYEVPPDPVVILPPSVLGWSLGDDSLDHDAPQFLGCNWAAWTKDLRDVEGFDTRFGPGGTSGGRGQEYSMQMKLLAAGILGRYVPGAHVWRYVPENRCSREWSLKRSYQMGLTEGANWKNESALFCGVPRWMLREWANNAAKAFWAKVRFRKDEAYLASHRLAQFRGIMTGFRQAHNAEHCRPNN